MEFHIEHTCFGQVSEAGVHRPHVAGIAGRENEGAYSIVLSGGYEDDTVSKILISKSLCLPGEIENIDLLFFSFIFQ